MTDHDVAVATPSDGTSEERPDRGPDFRPTHAQGGPSVALVESIFVDAKAPGGVEYAELYSDALRLTREVAQVRGGGKRPLPSVVRGGDDDLLLEERFVMGGLTRAVVHRRVSSDHAGRALLLDGFPLSRFARWYRDPSGQFGAAVFAEDEFWKTSVIVFEAGGEAGGLLRDLDEEPIVCALDGAFGSFHSRFATPFIRPGGQRVWDVSFRLQPLSPRGVDEIRILEGLGEEPVILHPSSDPDWETFELVDFLQHGPPEFVRLEFASADPAGDIEVAIVVDGPEPDEALSDDLELVVSRWVDDWTSDHVAAGLYLRIDPDDHLRVVGPAGLDLVVAAHDLSARAALVLRKVDRTSVIRLTSA